VAEANDLSHRIRSCPRRRSGHRRGGRAADRRGRQGLGGEFVEADGGKSEQGRGGEGDDARDVRGVIVGEQKQHQADDEARHRRAGGQLMEKPPNDGHRYNVLSPVHDRIGIAIICDKYGYMWMSQDFGDA